MTTFQKIIVCILCIMLSIGGLYADHTDVHTQQQLIERNIGDIGSKQVGEDIVRDFNQNHKNVNSPDLPEDATFQDAFDRGILGDQIDGPITRAALTSISNVQSANPSTSSTSTSSSSSSGGEVKPCTFDVDKDGKVQNSISDALDDCLKDSTLVDASGKIEIETGAKQQILTWTTAIAQLLGLLAVGAIVYGGLLMTLSGGEDEKIKKGKDVVKWAIIGFLGVIFAGVLVRIVVELMFTIASVT